MSYADAKEARDLALLEALHGSEGDTGIQCLDPITVTHNDPRRPTPIYDEDAEPGWNGPSFAVDASLIFPWMGE